MKKILVLCLLLLCMAGLTACGQEKEHPVKTEPATAVFQTNMGDFEVKLATDYAPKTSENFIKLAKHYLLYTSAAAADLTCVDLGGRRIIKKPP